MQPGTRGGRTAPRTTNNDPETATTGKVLWTLERPAQQSTASSLGSGFSNRLYLEHNTGVDILDKSSGASLGTIGGAY